MWELRGQKFAEINAACSAAILEGVDVETSQGLEHFSLTPTDQINITNLTLQIGAGAPAVLYHADSKLCRPFSAAEVYALAQAATQKVTYNQTLHNHLRAWIEREKDYNTLASITWDSPLPDDLAAHMAGLPEALADLQGGGGDE